MNTMLIVFVVGVVCTILGAVAFWLCWMRPAVADLKFKLDNAERDADDYTVALDVTRQGWDDSRDEVRELRNDLTAERAYSAACDDELARLRHELAGKALFPTLSKADVTVLSPLRGRS